MRPAIDSSLSSCRAARTDHHSADARNARSDLPLHKVIVRHARLYALGLISLIALQACDSGKTAPPAQAGPPPAMPVTVLNAQAQQVPRLVEVIGQAEGSREIEIRSRVTGILEKRLFQEGEAVAAGAALYYIERAPFEIALAQARAALAQESARAEQAGREERRLMPLADKQAISRREYDDAVSAVRTTNAALETAKARVREAELNLSYTTVRAPIAGITGRSVRSEGALVTPGSDGLLTTIGQTDPIWVRFAFSESQYAALRQGKVQEVSLHRADGAPLAASGRLNFAATSIDPRLGTVALRAEFANSKLAILPGQFVQARVNLGERAAFLVPQHAVMQNDQGRFVWIVGAGSTATPTPVQAAEWLGRDWVIEGGLKPGDQVIVDNLIKLRPGAPVQAKPASAPASAASSSSKP